MPSQQGLQTEFIHVNGAAEPLITAMIPEDVYTAATVTVGSASFTCIALQPSGGLIISEFEYGQTPTSDVTVTLPAPIFVSGGTAGLALDMLVSPSASWTSCNAGASSPYAITPTFTLSAFGSSSPAAASQNAAVAGLDGQVTALDGDSGGFQITLPASTSLHVTLGSATVWQGISSLTELHQGMFVDLDGALQSDGSVAASRVAVADPSAVDVQRGPLLLVASAVPILDMYPRYAQGKDLRVNYEQFSFNGSRFQVSGQLSNLESLPFTPTFGADNMVPGQTVYVSTPAFADTGSYNAVANTITLVPQTVNGTVTGVGLSGDFSVYTVAHGLRKDQSRRNRAFAIGVWPFPESPTPPWPEIRGNQPGLVCFAPSVEGRPRLFPAPIPTVSRTPRSVARQRLPGVSGDGSKARSPKLRARVARSVSGGIPVAHYQGTRAWVRTPNT